MPRPRKGPRLWLRRRKGRTTQWVILDGGDEHRTGCGASDLEGAERAFEGYIVGKHRPPKGPASLKEIAVADALNAYLSEHAPQTKSLRFIMDTTRPLLDWWGDRTLADIVGRSCREYAVWRRAQGVGQWTARHDLKTLSAAIRFYHREFGPLEALPQVVLPRRPPPRDRWLTRSEVAALLRAARSTPRLRHVARFILIAVYSGTRSRAVLALKWVPSADGGYFDLEREVLYRRPAAQGETKKRQPPARIHARLLRHLRAWREADLKAGITSVVHYQGAPVGKLRHSWERVRDLADLGADVVPHTCRHTAATWQMQGGIDHFEAAGYLGMSVETLVQVYGHHHPGFQSSAARASSKQKTRGR